MSLRSSDEGGAIYAVCGCTSSTKLHLEIVFIQKFMKCIIYREKIAVFLLQALVKEKEYKWHTVIIF
jgi:hypothetical protein